MQTILSHMEASGVCPCEREGGQLEEGQYLPGIITKVNCQRALDGLWIFMPPWHMQSA